MEQHVMDKTKVNVQLARLCLEKAVKHSMTPTNSVKEKNGQVGHTSSARVLNTEHTRMRQMHDHTKAIRDVNNEKHTERLAANAGLSGNTVRTIHASHKNGGTTNKIAISDVKKPNEEHINHYLVKRFEDSVASRTLKPTPRVKSRKNSSISCTQTRHRPRVVHKPKENAITQTESTISQSENNDKTTYRTIGQPRWWNIKRGGIIRTSANSEFVDSDTTILGKRKQSPEKTTIYNSAKRISRHTNVQNPTRIPVGPVVTFTCPTDTLPGPDPTDTLPGPDPTDTLPGPDLEQTICSSKQITDIDVMQQSYADTSIHSATNPISLDSNKKPKTILFPKKPNISSENMSHYNQCHQIHYNAPSYIIRRPSRKICKTNDQTHATHSLVSSIKLMTDTALVNLGNRNKMGAINANDNILQQNGNERIFRTIKPFIKNPDETNNIVKGMANRAEVGRVILCSKLETAIRNTNEVNAINQTTGDTTNTAGAFAARSYRIGKATSCDMRSIGIQVDDTY